MKTFRRPRVVHLRRPLLWGLCLFALAPVGVRAAGCMEMRGGELVISASDGCVARMRSDPAVRQQVAQRIGSEVGAQRSGSPVVAAAAPLAASTTQPPARGRSRGLDHPLARMSMLNSQSRYLWSLGNPAAVYYGQTQAP